MSFSIGPTGIWLCEDTTPHSFDSNLSNGIFHLCWYHGWTDALDLGCGDGRYVHALNLVGIPSRGLDGNPKTHDWSPYCYTFDVSKPIDECLPTDKPGPKLILSLETGEHIPREYEWAFLNNVAKAEMGVILSWFPRGGEGIGHVNPRPNEWVINQMNQRGFSFLTDDTNKLRASASLWWFKESLMVFKRIAV